MKILDRHEIDAALDKDTVIKAVREAFVSHSQGHIQSPSPLHMTFRDEAGLRTGDCHVKSAHSNHHKVIAIKVAIGMYKNAEKGVPVNNGLVLLLSRETGEPVALLQDEGLLTTYRTAAAGAIASGLASTKADDVLGIVGTGNQAFHQAEWTTHYLGLKKVMVFGRSTAKAADLTSKLSAHGLSAVRADSVAQLCANCRIVITTTPASDPIIMASDLPDGPRTNIHFVAVGADTHGKQELDAEILARAATVVADDLKQCLDHGDLAAANALGLIDPDQIVSLGSALAKGLSITEGVSVADLTGLGAQDLAIATLVT
ncbi:MAG: ornithine cyclodeaminase family protein [Boseongicola sp.]|nr:ornithine cyclodeaminase family protein [Boseongicola sp.]